MYNNNNRDKSGQGISRNGISLQLTVLFILIYFDCLTTALEKKCKQFHAYNLQIFATINTCNN